MAFNPRAVIGPVAATDEAVVRFDQTGQKVQNSSVFIADDGYLGVGTSVPVSALSLVGPLTLRETTASPHAISGYGELYAKTDHRLYFKGSDGYEHNLLSSSSGGVSGPGSSVDNALVRFQGTSGNQIDQSTSYLADDGSVGIRINNPVAGVHVFGAGSTPASFLAQSVGTADGYYSVLSTDAAANSYLVLKNLDSGSVGRLTVRGSAISGTFLGANLASAVDLSASGSNLSALLIGTGTAKPLILGTSNAERVRILSTGLVGIGISNPAKRLSVLSASDQDGISIVNSTSGQSAGLLVTVASGSGTVGISGATNSYATGSSAADLVLNSSAGGIGLGTAGIYRAYLAASGNLGIGTSTPASKLSLQDSADLGILISNTGANGHNWLVSDLAGSGAAGGLSFTDATASLERMRLDNAGNVGIGTSAAEERLDVLGNLLVRSATSAPSVIVRGGNSTTPRLALQGPAGTNHWTLGETVGVAGAQGQLAITDVSAAADRLTVSVGGNVGINTGSTTAQLTVRNILSQDTINIIDGSTEVLTLLDGGNLGLGQPAPQNIVHVSRSQDAQTALLIDNQTAGLSAASAIVIGPDAATGSTRSGSVNYQNSTDIFSISSQSSAELQLSSPNGPLTLVTNNVERLRVLNSGQVGIGTSAPTYQFVVSASTGNSEIVSESFQNAAGSADFIGKFARGTAGSPVLVQSGDLLTRLEGLGFDGYTYLPAAIISIGSAATPAAGTSAGFLTIGTTPTASSTPVERLRVLSNGFVGIGTATAFSTLHVRGSIGTEVSFISSNTTLNSSHSTVFVNASSGVTITLPLASATLGRRYEVKKTDATSSAMTIAAAGSDLIDGSANIFTDVRYESFTLVSDGVSNWYIV